jgi:hypothetical protein
MDAGSVKDAVFSGEIGFDGGEDVALLRKASSSSTAAVSFFLSLVLRGAADVGAISADDLVGMPDTTRVAVEGAG